MDGALAAQIKGGSKLKRTTTVVRGATVSGKVSDASPAATTTNRAAPTATTRAPPVRLPGVAHAPAPAKLAEEVVAKPKDKKVKKAKKQKKDKRDRESKASSNQSLPTLRTRPR